MYELGYVLGVDKEILLGLRVIACQVSYSLAMAALSCPPLDSAYLSGAASSPAGVGPSSSTLSFGADL